MTQPAVVFVYSFAEAVRLHYWLWVLCDHEETEDVPTCIPPFGDTGCTHPYNTRLAGCIRIPPLLFFRISR